MGAQAQRAKVFMTGRSQAVRIPADYRFDVDEVYIHKDPQNGNIVLSPSQGTWDEIFAVLDEAGFPDDFLADRSQGLPQNREEL